MYEYRVTNYNLASNQRCKKTASAVIYRIYKYIMNTIQWAILIYSWELMKSANKVVCTGGGLSMGNIYTFVYTVKYVCRVQGNYA